jgi:hypothetical protein
MKINWMDKNIEMKQIVQVEWIYSVQEHRLRNLIETSAL